MSSVPFGLALTESELKARLFTGVSVVERTGESQPYRVWLNGAIARFCRTPVEAQKYLDLVMRSAEDEWIDTDTLDGARDAPARGRRRPRWG